MLNLKKTKEKEKFLKVSKGDPNIFREKMIQIAKDFSSETMWVRKQRVQVGREEEHLQSVERKYKSINPEIYSFEKYSSIVKAKAKINMFWNNRKQSKFSRVDWQKKW